jgi:hypothetical protein
MLALLLAPRGASADAREDTAQLLDRATRLVTPTAADREVARDLLSDWVDTHPDDVYLRHAFIRIAEGRPPGAEELAALNRLNERYVRAAREAAAREGAAPPTGALPARTAPPSRARRSGAAGDILALGAMTAVVVAAGIAWIIFARRRSDR